MVQRYGGFVDTTIPPSCHLAYHMYGILGLKTLPSPPIREGSPTFATSGVCT